MPLRRPMQLNKRIILVGVCFVLAFAGLVFIDSTNSQNKAHFTLFSTLMALHDARPGNKVDISGIICPRYDTQTLLDLAATANALEHQYYPKDGIGVTAGDDFWSYFKDEWLLTRVTLHIHINRITKACDAHIQSHLMTP
jgi:hypothetical protein